MLLSTRSPKAARLDRLDGSCTSRVCLFGRGQRVGTGRRTVFGPAVPGGTLMTFSVCVRGNSNCKAPIIVSGRFGGTQLGTSISSTSLPPA